MAVHVHGVTHRYGDTTVLDNVNLHIPAGSRHAIIGPNGAGKTTLLGLITGTARPSSGRILFDERDVTRLPLHRRSRLGMSRTWQQPAVVTSLTAIDNVALAIPGRRLNDARRNAVRLLELAGLSAERHITAADLSHGQRQVLELVTAVAAQPRLLILDELSTGLGEQPTAELLRRLLGDVSDITLVFTDHSPKVVAALADTITELRAGRQQRLSPSHPRAEATASTVAATRQTEPDDQASSGAALELVDVSVGDDRHPAVAGITLRLEPGEVVALTGIPGAGRTTLVKVIAGLLPAAAGSRILLNASDITNTSAAQRAQRGVGTVLQAPTPLHGLTVADQLSIARSTPMSLPPEALALAPWLPARMRQPVHTLSGGERQILAVVCALARQPTVLVLDEAAEGMSHQATGELLEIIRSVASRGAAVLITEAPDGPLVQVADHEWALQAAAPTMAGR
ncbi:ATP-binding cassette domain-containing protein [Dactylosporangium sp. NPDC005572]|uniref:ATP-binding cassette domain-containing protein n=1 Tax=Dactylosporangium sp. NPDC005572 TaxID=3156889 RepID=UPI0033BD5839